MNGNHFNIHDLKREYEKGRKQGAVEELKHILKEITKMDSNITSGNEMLELIEKRLLELEKGEIVNG